MFKDKFEVKLFLETMGEEMFLSWRVSKQELEDLFKLKHKKKGVFGPWIDKEWVDFYRFDCEIFIDTEYGGEFSLDEMVEVIWESRDIFAMGQYRKTSREEKFNDHYRFAHLEIYSSEEMERKSLNKYYPNKETRS